MKPENSPSSLARRCTPPRFGERRLRCALVLASVSLLVGTPSAQGSQHTRRADSSLPHIARLSAATLERSGRLVVSGSGFGMRRMGAKVLVDGRAAFVTRWSDRRIHAYVPEQTSLGPVAVEVRTRLGASNRASLTVTRREPVGNLLWRFTADSLAIRHRPGIGPDGTVYAQDTGGILYALAPDGGLRWLRDLGDEGSEGPVVVASDGTVFAPVNPLGPAVEIWALHPDGSVKWVYQEANGGQGLLAGPGIGPDGNVYAVTDLTGPGAVSLDAETGDLLWSNVGSPPMNEIGQLGIEMAFGADRFYVAFEDPLTSPIALLHGFDLNGEQLFAVGRPNDNAQPVVGPTGNVYVESWVSGAGIRLRSYDADGHLRWTAFGSPTNVLTHPDVGPDESVYVVRNGRELWSLSGEGSTNWRIVHQDILYAPIVSPDGSTLAMGGAAIGSHGFFTAIDAAAGSTLWLEPIPADPNGSIVFASTRPRFAPDGRTAYAGAEPGANPSNDLHCYLYALNTARK